MSRNRNNFFLIVKWLIMLAAYGFLIYKLANIEYWTELQNTFREISFQRFLFLIAVVMLMPINWLLEARKWQKLTEKSVFISLKTSIKSVLGGLSTGYITPNRIGDFAGRVLFLPKESRLTGIILSIVNSLTQNIVITIFGLTGAVVYFTQHYGTGNFSDYLLWIGIGFGLSLLLYFSFPKLAQKIKTGTLSLKIRKMLQSISSFKFWDLMVVIFISIIRYLVFCTQYYLLLQFFGITVPLHQALIAIPTMYLLITFTPSLAAAEPAVRGSYAVLILSVFSSNEIGIMLTGILIWLINFVVPMVIGTILIGMIKSTN